MKHFNLLRLPLIVGATFALVACGGSGSETPSTEPAASKPVKVEKEVVTKTPAETPVKAAEMDEAALLKRGRIVWFKCRSCHELGVDGPHKVGPNLNGIMGATVGKKEGFVYSKVMESSDIVWTDETLDAFITKPATYFKGTKMAFVGIRKESDRKAVIEYMRKEAKAP